MGDPCWSYANPVLHLGQYISKQSRDMIIIVIIKYVTKFGHSILLSTTRHSWVFQHFRIRIAKFIHSHALRIVRFKNT